MDRLEEQTEVTWRANWSKAKREEVRREEASRDVERGGSAAVALMQLTPAYITGCGCAARGYMNTAAEAWLPHACLAGYGDMTRRSVAAAALAWLPSTFLAGDGDGTRRSVAAAALS